MALKRLVLDNDSDAYVLAISCHQKSTKLAWEINRVLHCELQLVEEYGNNIYFIDSIEGFPYFNWTDPEERFTIHLIGNRSENALLVPSQKQIDYFFVVTGFYAELDFEEGVKKIKQISSVLTAFPVVLDKIKR
ncbi:MAG: IPExxxVDY family protein [Salibacteraceae bacterium]